MLPTYNALLYQVPLSNSTWTGKYWIVISSACWHNSSHKLPSHRHIQNESKKLCNPPSYHPWAPNKTYSPPYGTYIFNTIGQKFRFCTMSQESSTLNIVSKIMTPIWWWIISSGSNWNSNQMEVGVATLVFQISFTTYGSLVTNTWVLTVCKFV